MKTTKIQQLVSAANKIWGRDAFEIVSGRKVAVINKDYTVEKYMTYNQFKSWAKETIGDLI